MKNRSKILLALLIVLTLTVGVFAITTSAASDQYVVAGQAGLCGSEWNGSDSQNIMTLDATSGCYYKIYQDVDVDEGGYQLKVVENGSSWYGDESENNVWVKVTEQCSTVVVSFNPSNNVTSAVATATVAGSASLCGSGWSTTDTANDMTFDFETGLFTKIYENVSSGTYEFKVALNQEWKISYPSSNYSITVSAEDAGDDIKITFNPLTKEVVAEIVGLPGAGTESDPYVISDVYQLEHFRDSVNAGYTKYSAPGVYVTLGADIDLQGINWTPIGSAYIDHGFMGNFDGNGYVISNLTINNPVADADGYVYSGFFGVTEGTDKDNQNYVKNLTIENVDINTDGHIVAAAIAYPHYTVVDNVKVCGDISITGGDYTSGVLAYTRRCVNASNLYVEGNDGSTITGGKTVGGVVSDIQMNGGLKAVYSNFNVSGVTISGDMSVGGISGIISGQTLTNGSVNNVVLSCSDNRVGIVSGSLGSASVISGVTYENVTGANMVVGATYSNGECFVATIGYNYYTSIQAAVDAASDGDTVTLLRDVSYTGSSRLVIEGKVLTLDLGGYAITGEHVVINIKYGSNVTIKNGTVRDTSSNACAIQLYGAKATLAADLDVIADFGAAVTVYGKDGYDTVLTTYADLTTNDTDCDSAISGQGAYDGTVINVAGGTLNSANGVGIYHPQNGTLNITGGTINANTGIIMKSGTLNITGGTINATGAQADYEYVSSSYVLTGDAVVIENVGGDTGYEAITSVVISGGSFYSENASDIASYAATEVNAEAEAVTGFVSGGEFSSELDSALCIRGFRPVKNANGNYVIVESSQYPYIKDGTWWIGDVDTQVSASGDDGISPYVGENGNWWIGDTDTKVAVVGTKGNDISVKLEDGKLVITITKADGTSETITTDVVVGSDGANAFELISVTEVDGEYVITYKLGNEVSSFTIPAGVNGEQGDKGEQGDPGVNGKDGEKGDDGKDGEDGADNDKHVATVIILSASAVLVSIGVILYLNKKRLNWWS